MPPPRIGTQTFTHDVFLSHSSEDKVVVRPLAERLHLRKLARCRVFPDYGAIQESEKRERPP
jgi:hypothetical protein